MNPDPPPVRAVYADVLRICSSDHGLSIDKGIPGFFWGVDGRAGYDHSHH
jgi:hypothetical protein